MDPDRASGVDVVDLGVVILTGSHCNSAPSFDDLCKGSGVHNKPFLEQQPELVVGSLHHLFADCQEAVPGLQCPLAFRLAQTYACLHALAADVSGSCIRVLGCMQDLERAHHGWLALVCLHALAAACL